MKAINTSVQSTMTRANPPFRKQGTYGEESGSRAGPQFALLTELELPKSGFLSCRSLRA